MNQIYVLRRIKNRKTPTYDCNDGHVIRAPSDALARVLASRVSRGDEGPEVWMDPLRSTCEVLDPSGPTGLVMTDFNAG